jgi:hypothetical protein
MRRFVCFAVLVWAAAHSAAQAQVLTTTTFTEGAGIALANQSGQPFADQTYAELVAADQSGIGQYGINIDTASSNNEGLLRFNGPLFGAEAGQIPAGAHIARATLKLRTVDVGDGAYLHRLLTPFVSETDTWNAWGSGENGRNSEPGVQADDIEAVGEADVFTAPQANGITRLDVTNSLKAWQAAGDAAAANAANLGWHFDAYDSGGWDFVNFDAPEAGLRPQLEVILSDVAPTTLALQQGLNGYQGTVDTYLREAESAASFGEAPGLVVDRSDDGGQTLSLVKFTDFMGEGAGKMPADAQLVSAKLSLHLFSEGGDGLELFRVQGAWDETSTWDSAATKLGIGLESVDGLAYVQDVQQGTFLDFDVTSSVQAWLAGADNNGWVIGGIVGAASGVEFDSADGPNGEFAPRLELTFVPAPAAAVPEPATWALLACGGLVWLAARRARGLMFAALAIAVGMTGSAQAQGVLTSTFTEGTGIAISFSPNDASLADKTYAELQGGSSGIGNGEWNVDAAPVNNEVLLRFDEPIFGDGAGLVPLGGFIVNATLKLETTGNGNGANLHRLKLPFDADADTWNSWGSGAGGRNGDAGVQSDDVEAYAVADLSTGGQTEGLSLLDVTTSLKAWQEAGSVETANAAAGLGWFFDSVGTNGWDIANFSGAEGAAPQLEVTYTAVPPTMKTFQQGLGGYNGATDTFVSSGAPAANQGAAGGLTIGKVSTGDGQDVGLIKFDNLFGAGDGQVPANAEIVLARLKFHVTDGGDGFEMRRMLTDWSGSATWADSFTDASMALVADGSSGGGTDDGTIVVDVSAAVKAWQGGAANYGWALAPLFGTDDPLTVESSEAAASPLGDANGDLNVDLTDFGILKDNFGSGTTLAQGDFNSDGKVDLTDFGLLKDNFGSSGQPSLGRPLLEVLYVPSAAAAVPEPSSWLLAVVGFAALGLLHRRRR